MSWNTTVKHAFETDPANGARNDSRRAHGRPPTYILVRAGFIWSRETSPSSNSVPFISLYTNLPAPRGPPVWLHCSHHLQALLGPPKHLVGAWNPLFDVT